jgi:hypothetical protein
MKRLHFGCGPAGFAKKDFPGALSLTHSLRGEVRVRRTTEATTCLGSPSNDLDGRGAVANRIEILMDIVERVLDISEQLCRWNQRCPKGRLDFPILLRIARFDPVVDVGRFRLEFSNVGRNLSRDGAQDIIHRGHVGRIGSDVLYPASCEHEIGEHRPGRAEDSASLRKQYRGATEPTADLDAVEASGPAARDQD